MTDAALSYAGPDVPDELLDGIRALLDADTCSILLLDEERHELVAHAALGIEEELEPPFHIPVGKGFAGRVAAELRPVVLPDVEHADVLNPLIRRQGIASLVGVPLVVDGRSIGVLHVGTLQRRDFTRDEVDLLQLAADRVAIAISHARAFESERAARRRIEDVQAIVDAGLAHLELVRSWQSSSTGSARSTSAPRAPPGRARLRLQARGTAGGEHVGKALRPRAGAGRA